MWQRLEEGRADNGVDNLQVQRHTWLVPKLYRAGEPQNPTWAEARRRVGCSRCCCLWPHRGPSRALSPGDGEMMAGKPPPSPACEVLPEVSPPRLSDVWLYVPWLSAICCSQGSGKMVGGHLCGRSGCNGFFPLKLFPSQEVCVVPPFTSNTLGKRIAPPNGKRKSLGLAWVAT